MVLQARYKAEEVWYAVVGEKEKELPNVIDYNIKPEITKDTSAVENANNDTTTGMADVIPWINAPKLIADTSIIGWWLSVTNITATQNIWQSQTAVNTYVIESWNWDIYLDANAPSQIYTNWWTYLICVSIYTTNSNASVTWYLTENRPWMLGNYILQISQSWWSSKSNSYTTVSTVPAWTYYKIWVTLWWSQNYSTKFVVTFVKLA